MLLIQQGALKPNIIFNSWFDDYKNQNYGAFVTFTGIVRAENSILGLSFEIYEPILRNWFDSWQQKAEKLSARILMAHSTGDVLLHESSFMCTVLSPKRRVALELIDEFVEDFKASAPIWKYDIMPLGKIYAKDRSTKLQNAGILL